MALGHWLKDYIGPRASANSGGGTEPLILMAIDDSDGSHLDKTFGEIKEAFNSGRSIWFTAEVTDLGVSGFLYAPITRLVIYSNEGGSISATGATFDTSSDSNYPKEHK